MRLRNESASKTEPGDRRQPTERREGVYEVWNPKTQKLPIVLSSPHSGDQYPTEFLEKTRLDCLEIRRSEDAFVHQIFRTSSELGVPMIRAVFPRVYLDVNREPFELDPGMFREPLPSFVPAATKRAMFGYGTIARLVGEGRDVYRGKLTFSEIQDRINRLYFPFHARLEELIRSTLRRFGICILLDAHSMPKPQDEDDAPDIVLGDGFGSTCMGLLTASAERIFSELDYRVVCNHPYAGGFIIRHYGNPAQAVHALQIEIRRSLYMDEATLTPLPAFATLAENLRSLIREIGRLARSQAA